MRRKEKGRSRVKSRGVRITMGVSVAALIAAVAVYIMLLQIEKSYLDRYEKGVVYIAAKQLPKGEMITQDAYGDYFATMEMDRECIPDSALGDLKEIEGLAAVYDVEQGNILTAGMFETLESVLQELKNPVIAAFKADDMYQVAGGVLRAGDRIHIYTVCENETQLMWENVYVQQVFNISGEAISGKDKDTVAQRVNIYMEKEDIEEFYSGLANGSLRVVKICN